MSVGLPAPMPVVLICFSQTVAEILARGAWLPGFDTEGLSRKQPSLLALLSSTERRSGLRFMQASISAVEWLA